MEGLLFAMRHQLKLAKDASTALVELGQAIHTNATHEEAAMLLQGTLLQEAHVRTSCLQTLQVPFSLLCLIFVPCTDTSTSRSISRIWTGLPSCSSRPMTKMSRTLDWLVSYGKITVWTCPRHFCRRCSSSLVGLIVLTVYNMKVVLKNVSSAEHDNAYVRSSTAAAFIECVEHSPQSITETLAALEDLYRGKVRTSVSVRISNRS